ncbi:helix-turn-helix domain-containing protein [Aquiluna sp. Uisw_065]|uniref:helix-turn-helix domain-containing protein n=1 Tax=Aquiluna sp. Uisw_065 TaxID=3230967 RepID=UPI0039E748C7
MTIKRQDGFAMIPNVIARSGRLNPNALAVYVCLKSHAGTTNKTWVSHKTISKEVKLSVSAVKTALKQLKEVGLIDWKGRIRPTDGRQTSNDYQILDSERRLARLFPTTPQSSGSYQEEQSIEEESLNTPLSKRGRKRNQPSDQEPATAKQFELIRELFIEHPGYIGTEPTIQEFDQMSKADADYLINEMKVSKWKEEMYG